MAGSSVGGVVFPQMTQHLIPDVGFSWTVRTCAFVVLGLMIFAIPAVSSNWEHKPRPFDIGIYLRPVGELNFCILAASCFLLYCKRTSQPHTPLTSPLQSKYA